MIVINFSRSILKTEYQGTLNCQEFRQTRHQEPPSNGTWPRQPKSLVYKYTFTALKLLMHGKYFFYDTFLLSCIFHIIWAILEKYIKISNVYKFEQYIFIPVHFNRIQKRIYETKNLKTISLLFSILGWGQNMDIATSGYITLNWKIQRINNLPSITVLRMIKNVFHTIIVKL